MNRSADFSAGAANETRRAFEADKARLVDAMGADAGNSPPALSKKTSNLFRSRNRSQSRRLPRVGMNQVLRIEPDAGWAEVAGLTPYETFVREALPHGVMPAVVPELKSITVGGALAGGGIESSSFKFGYVHETALALEVLTGDGNVMFCTPDNENRDLFFGLPNSYGTLGYVLRAWMRVVAVEPFVELRHEVHRDPREGLARIAHLCAENREPEAEVDFIDASWFGDAKGMVITTAAFTREASEVSDYKGMRIYYQSLLRKTGDLLTTEDYIWRWDTDWFWCSRAFGMENPLIRAPMAALGALRSTTYWKIRSLLEKSGVLALLDRIRPAEFVIQDVEIPTDRGDEFLEFFDREVGILPVWICPAQSPEPGARFSLFEMNAEKLYLNFGFWSSVPGRHAPGHHNRLIENMVCKLGGRKSLYSSSYFPEDEFWKIYNRPAYDALKQRHDPRNRLRDLYEKCVKGM